MSPNIFDQQLIRLQNAFGKETFNTERAKLVWAELRAVPDKQALQIINWCIGEFTPQYPPKVSHFREQAEAQLKWLRQQESAQAAQKWKEISTDRTSSNEGLKKVLEELEAKSLLEAIKKTRRV